MEPLQLMARRVAHDFNNLLQPVVGYLHLAMEAEDREKATLYLSRAIAGAEAARSLVERVSRIGQLDRQQATRVALNDVVGQTLERFREEAPANIAVETALEDTAMEVVVVPERVAEMLTNLFTNACEAMAGGGTLVVSTSRAVPGDDEAAGGGFCDVEVADDGVGMEEETLARAFDPFFSTKVSGIGRGLGLTLVYDIVTELGAEIFVDSVPGRGTSFRIRIPAARDGSSDVTSEPEEGS